MKKKVLALTLALCLALALVPVASAATPIQITWLPVSGYPYSYDRELNWLTLDDDYNYPVIDLTTNTKIFDDIAPFSEGLARVWKNGKCGYIDKTGAVVISLEYDDAWAWGFSEGLAAVGKGSYPNAKYGYIDKTGAVVIAMEYDWVEDFSEGLARVEKDGKWGYIDQTGAVVVPLGEYDSTCGFSEGLAWVNKDGKWGCVDQTGAVVIPLEYDYYFDYYGLYYDSNYDFFEGLAQVGKKDPHGNMKYGYIDKTGAVMVPPEYDSIRGFSESLAVVGKEDAYGNMKYGFVDKTGAVVIPMEYDYDAWGFSEDLAVMGKKDANGNMKYGFIDKTGAVAIPLEYDGADDFSEGMAMAKKDGKWGCIDQTGAVVVPMEYDWVWDFSEGLAEVSREDAHGNTKYGYIDQTGAVVIPLEYDDTWGFSEGLAWVEKDGKYGYIDKTGAVVIPLEYDGARGFSGGLAWVKKDGKCGCIDQTGAVVIPLEYDDVWYFSDGLARVGKEDAHGNMKYGYIDQTGAVVVPLEYDYCDNEAHNRGDGGILLEDGLYYVQKGEKVGVFINPYWTSEEPTAVAYPSTQTVLVDGAPVTFHAYALKDANGNDTNYIKLRDVADILNGSAAQFAVGWDGSITITTKTAYTPNGSENIANFSGNQSYTVNTSPVKVNGAVSDLEAITLTDSAGGGYTYFKLRDLGAALGFTVDWNAANGITIDSTHPYDPAN